MNREIPQQELPGTTRVIPWDAWGQALSVLCMAHCLLLPLVLGVLPVMMTRSLEEAPVHLGMVVGAALIGGVGFVWGFRHHQDWRVLVLGSGGLAMLALAQLLPEGLSETGVTLAGGTLLVVAHGLNRRLSQACCSVAVGQTR